MNIRGLLALNLAGILAWAWAPGRVLGVATAEGDFRVDRAAVSGNATLFEGATIETLEAASRLRIDKGTRVELASESRARVFGNRTLLDRGLSEMQTSAGYQLEALSLRIATAGPKSVARVRLEGEREVLVAAVNGPVRVFHSSGLLLANVKSGTTLRFDPQAAAQDAFEFSGCLLRKAGKLILVDQTANQTVEVRGDAAKLGAEVGNRVRVKGTGTGTPLVLDVQALEQVGLGGCLAVATSVGADPPSRAPAPPPAAAERERNSALIAGVAIAGAGGAIAGVVLATRKQTKSP